MKKRQTNGDSCRDARAVLRACLHGMAMLGMLTLAACDLGRLDALFEVGGEGRMAEPTGRQNRISKEDIRAVQESLADLGYEPGEPDGRIGAQTKTAIRRYQAAAGLPVDGRVSLALLGNIRKNPVWAPAADQASGKSAGALPPPFVGRSVAEDEIVIDGGNNELAPVYEIGDEIAWSDGLIETVVRVGDDKIFWRGSNGISFNASWNFIVPPSSWDAAAGPGNAVASVNAAQVWPLPTGKSIKFQVSTTGSSGVEVVRDWTCRRRGRTKLTVPAGTFDTLVITCSRNSVVEGEWLHRTWFYAPAARHYVRRVDWFDDGSIRAVGLVAIRPGGQGWPAAARAGLDWAVQEALNERAVGSSTDWGSTGVQAKFEIMPTGSRTTEAGETCRTFVLIHQFHGDARSYPSIACKDSGTGIWLTPVLDKGAVSAGAVAAGELG